jgi:hypothetical protein
MAMQMREQVCTPHKVPTDHLADMGGPYIRRHQPRLQYAEVGGKFIVNNEHVNPFVGRRVWREFPKAQVHVILGDTDVKLDTPNFQGCLQPKRSPIKEAAH